MAKKKGNTSAIFVCGILIGLVMGTLFVFFMMIFDFNDTLENNGLMKIEDCDSVLEPCVCCGELCQGYKCDWEKRYWIDSDECRLK